MKSRAGDPGLARAMAESCERLASPQDDAFSHPFDRWARHRVLMLGEASHGTSEFYAARAAITRRMIERHGSARAHEFLDADLDHRVAAIVLKVGNTVPSHVMLRHVEE